MTVFFNSGSTGTYFGNPTGSGLYFDTGRVPLNWPLIFRELDTATQAVVNAATVKPSSQRQIDMDNLVRDLKAASIWNSLDLIYVLANETSQLACLNWKAPTTFAATPTLTPTFTQNRGFTGNGTNSYLATSWNFSTNAVNYTQNSAMLGIWNLTALPNTSLAVGTIVAGKSAMTPKGGTGGVQFRFRMNNSAAIELGAITDASGLSVAVRTDANTVAGYKNGTLFGAPTTVVSEALDNDTFGLLRGFGTYFNGQLSVGFAGASITAAQHAQLYTALQTYLRATGAIN